MKIKCKKCKTILRKRKNHPFGQNSKPRVTYYCDNCKEYRNLKGG